MFCEKCGKELMDDATLCSSCGWKTPKWHKEVKESKINHKANIAGMIVGIIVVFLFLLLFLEAI